MHASASSPPRPNTNGSPPLSRTTSCRRGPRSTSSVVDLVLRHRDAPGRLADVDELGVAAARGRAAPATPAGRRRRRRRARSSSAPRTREQPGIAGPGADEVHGHGDDSSERRAARARPVRRAGRARRARPTSTRDRVRRRARAQHDVAVERREQHVEHDRRSVDDRASAPQAGCSRRRARRGTRARRRPPVRVDVVDRGERGARLGRRRRGTRRERALPTCGSITDGSSTSVDVGRSRPSRSSAATATTTAS